MTNFRQEFTDAAANLICAGSRGLGNLLRQNSVFPFGVIEQIVARQIAYDAELLFCNKEPRDIPPPGGFCDFKYRVTIFYTMTGHPFPQFNGQFTHRSIAWGPIGSASYREVIAPEPSGRIVIQIGFTSHGGEFEPRQENPVYREFPFQEFHQFARLVINGISAVPLDPRDSEDCGGFRPIPPYDPRNHTHNTIINYTNNEGNTFNVPIVGILGMGFLNIKGELNIPIKMNFNIRPTLNLNPQFNPTFNFNLSTGDATYESPQPDVFQPEPPAPAPPALPPIIRPDSPAPPAPPGIPDPPPDEDDEEAGRVIVGALVTVTEIARPLRQSIIFQGDNPDVWVPDLGLISFAISIPGGGTGWTSDIRIKNQRQYVPCPEPTGAVNVRGTPAFGNVWTITPVYRSKDALGI